MIPLQVATIREYVQNTIVPNVVEFATNAATFLLTVAVVYYVGKAILLPLAERTLRARGAGETLVKPARKLTLVGVGFLAVTVGFAVAGFGNLLSSLATIVAALTLAIGFASQDLIGNLVAGAFLIGDPKVKIGDWIEWNDKEGIIEDISFRVSRVRTFDNGLITVPNSELANTALENPVAKDKRRIQFLFGVGYEEDLDHARDVIIEELGPVDLPCALCTGGAAHSGGRKREHRRMADLCTARGAVDRAQGDGAHPDHHGVDPAALCHWAVGVSSIRPALAVKLPF